MRLLIFDGRLSINLARATFARWHDRILAVVMFIAGIAAIRSWCATQPRELAAWTALAVGVIIGSAGQRLISERLNFHGSDGVLAVDALSPPTRRRYATVCHVAGIAAFGAIVMVTEPSLVILGIAGYSAGVLATWLMSRLKLSSACSMKMRSAWPIQEKLRRARAGLAGGVVCLVLLLPTKGAGLTAISGVETALFLLPFTSLDDKAVKLMSFAGHPSQRIVAYSAKSLASFACVVVPSSFIFLGLAVGGTVATVVLGCMGILILRTLLYIPHKKRLSDILLAVLLAIFIAITFSFPPALPVLAIGIIWKLHRQGNAARWLAL